MQAQLIPIVGGAVAGLLPTILTAVVSWLNNRGIQARRTAALALAQQRIAFLLDWIKAQEGLTTPDQLDGMKNSVSAELDGLRSQLNDILDEHRRVLDIAEERPLIQKIFLTYGPRSSAAWVFHTLFYMSLGVTAILFLVTATGYPGDPQGMYTTLGCFDVPALILTFVFRQLALQADKRAQQLFKPVLPPQPAAEPASAASSAD